MILTLDIGNTSIHGGVFPSTSAPEPTLQFRKSTQTALSSDEFGLFLRAVLRENGFQPEKIREIALCSVVPDAIHSIRGACTKYFNTAPFVLQAGAKTGLRIKYRNPLEVGSDRIANAIAAIRLFPGKNLIVVDYGTATTFCAVTAEKDYLGGLILPGFRISMEALENRTARLPSVELLKPTQLVGQSTVESIQAGLYYGNLCAVKGITERIREQYFRDTTRAGESPANQTLVIGTGGFSRLLESEGVFDHLVPELVLLGLRDALRMNAELKRDAL